MHAHGRILVSVAVVLVTIGCGESPDAPDVTPAEVVLSSPDTLRSIGATSDITATVNNASHQPLTGHTVTWETSNAAIVTVSLTGTLTAVANGMATITGRAGTLSATRQIVVHQRVTAVAVSGATAMGSFGSSTQLTVAAADAGGAAITGRTVQWTSSAPAIVSITATGGLATAAGNGTATITATIDGTPGTHQITVSQVPVTMTITAPTDTMRALTATAQYSAVVKDSGGATIVAPGVQWATRNATLVTVTAAGLATAVSNGSTYIVAQAAALLDSTRLTVRQRIDPSKSVLSAARQNLFVGDSLRLTVSGRDSLNQAMAAGGATVNITSSGGSSTGTHLATVDQGNGTYTSDFVGSALGSPKTATATVNGVAVPNTAPIRVVGFTKVVAHSAGFPLTCGIVTTGDLYCWGTQVGGVRGRGPGAPPVSDRTPTLVSGSSTWTDVAIGNLVACGINQAGKLFCWGDASEGQMGNGVTNGNFPTPVAIAPDSSFESVSISLLGGACAVTIAHNTMCWGSGTWGRLGNGTDVTSAAPVGVTGGVRFSRVGTSFDGTCALSETFAAYCWGHYASLGIGFGPYPSSCGGVDCAKAPVAVSGGLTFKPIFVRGGGYTCGVATDDRTYCWGIFSNVPTEIAGAPVFTALAIGDSDACGVAQDGSIHCWGTNRNGRFGLPKNGNATFPVTLIESSRVYTQISMGQETTCALVPDGNAWCWGTNANGELGDGTTTASTTPVRVRLFGP